MTSAVPRDSVKDMDFWYSSTQWKDILGADDAETICVPPCLDVLKSWRREDIDEAPYLRRFILGQKGEAAFMLKFQELNMGGILLSGLETCDLVASRTVRKKVVEHGEWDAIFFHQNRGIFVIEVKATEIEGKYAVDDRIEKAKTQLARNITNIKQSFLSLYQEECTCITGFICFPFRNEDRDTYEGYRIIDKSALNDPAIFRQFFEPQANERMTEVSLLQSFAAEFVCCRSQVEFHSQAYNAMKIATWIMEQDIVKKKDPTMLDAREQTVPGNGPSGKIILTAQQLEIAECREKCVTMRGAPGSGKTLILMLRALKAAMENRPGSVFVFVNEKLKAKYEHFFFEEKDKIFVDDASNIDRTPNVLTIDMITFVKPEDDIFFDETPVEDSYIEKMKSRVNCSGSTTVVFTGLHKPGDAVALFRLYRPRLKEFRHFELTKVLRSTAKIFEKWEEYYPHSITIGHNIFGVAVKSDVFESFEQVQNEIANKIITLTNTNISNTNLPSLKKEHIAVITCDNDESKKMRNYFEMKNIHCGQVNKQARKLKSTSIVAVDVYLNTPSYEWPIVFIVLNSDDMNEEVLPIAASRCIASLTIVTYKNLQATASSIKADELEPTEEDIVKELNIQKSLKDIYSRRFRKVYPFSMPFTLDTENTWVSLAMKEEKNESQATENHAVLLKRAFMQKKMLIIEGDPATGKTSLMQRLAYEWAKGNQELLCYDLVLYAEFREVREKTFESIVDLVLHYYSENLLNREKYKKLEKLINSERFCQERRILVLLDGYDESSLEKQCSELKTYLFDNMIDKAFVFNVVITTRKGYLSNLRGREGRFLFAEVLGFTTKQQKEKFVYNYFLPSEIDSKRNIAAVRSLLGSNQNLNKLAETPLFLTFICLVHERIINGTLVELYCNIIWWLIDRHQQDFPNRDIPSDFGFQNGSSNKFETIQEHYLHFPQLHCLGKMALCNLQENVFTYSDCEQFHLQPIIEQVGLLRTEKKYDDPLKLTTTFLFPHRTIQEFLAAFYCFCSNDRTSEWLLPNFELNTSKMNEFRRFLLRIALSNKMPIHLEKRKHYFERIAHIELNTKVDAFNTTAGFDNKLLNWFLSQCTNAKYIRLTSELSGEKHATHMLHGTSIHNESAVTFLLYSPTLSSYNDLIKLHSLSLCNCTFEANSQLSFTNCPSLEILKFIDCEIESNVNLCIATLPAIDTVEFNGCRFDLATWQSITDQISNSSVKRLQLALGKDISEEFLVSLEKCNNIEKMDITIQDYNIRQNSLLSSWDLIKLQSLTLISCTFEAQLSFTNCLTLKNLIFRACVMKSSTIVGIATLLAIDTVEFNRCIFDLATWQSTTDLIRNSSVRCLQLIFGEDFNEEFLINLQKCNNIEKMDITIQDYNIRQNSLLSSCDLIRLQSLTLISCTFEGSSQPLFPASYRQLRNPEIFLIQKITTHPLNSPSLKNLEFRQCEIKRSAIDIATLSAIDTVQFDQCLIDSTTWQSITDQIRKSNVNCLHLSVDYFVKERHTGFLHNLQNCERIQKIHILDIYDWNAHGHILDLHEEDVTANLAQAAQNFPGLMSIIIASGERRLKEKNKERIEKAGQKRKPNFSLKYMEPSI